MVSSKSMRPSRIGHVALPVWAKGLSGEPRALFDAAAALSSVAAVSPHEAKPLSGAASALTRAARTLSGAATVSPEARHLSAAARTLSGAGIALSGAAAASPLEARHVSAAATALSGAGIALSSAATASPREARGLSRAATALSGGAIALLQEASVYQGGRTRVLGRPGYPGKVSLYTGTGDPDQDSAIFTPPTGGSRVEPPRKKEREVTKTERTNKEPT